MATLVFFLFALLYLITTNQLFSFDAVSNAIACEQNNIAPWFHSNHLLYPFLGAVWFRIEKLFSYHGYAIYSLARFNSLMAAAGLAIFFLALSKYMTKTRAGIATSFLGSTYAVWAYAVDGRAIGVTVFFSSLLIWFLASKRKSVWEAAFLSALYVLSHAIGIFHVAALARFFDKQQDRRKALLYTSGALGLIAIAYLAVYAVLSNNGSSTFFSWALGYAGHSGAGKALNSPFWAGNAAEIVLGLWRGWANAFYRPLSHRPLDIFFSHGIAGLFLIGLALATKKIKKRSNFERRFFWTLVLWGGLVTAFLAFWSPGQEGFRLHVLVPWSAALFIAFKDVKPVFQGAAVAAAFLFSLNFSGPIYYNAFIQNNAGYQLLTELSSHLQPSDILLAGTSDTLPGYEVLRPYFFPDIQGGTLSGWLLVSGNTSLEPLKQNFSNRLKEGRRIYWTDDVTAPELVSAFDKKPAFLLSNGVTVLSISPKK